jgi:hypothetical protein
MLHKSKSAFKEYWSYNDGLFTLLYTIIAVDFYHVEALPGSFILFKSQFCGPYICLFRVWSVH